MASYTVHLMIEAESDHDALKQAGDIRRVVRDFALRNIPVVEVTDSDDWSEHVDMMCGNLCGGLADDRTRWGGGRRWCKPCMVSEGKKTYPVVEG